jgi:hypothetical protein
MRLNSWESFVCESLVKLLSPAFIIFFFFKLLSPAFRFLFIYECEILRYLMCVPIAQLIEAQSGEQKVVSSNLDVSNLF